jgi:hypothetical protein
MAGNRQDNGRKCVLYVEEIFFKQHQHVRAKITSIRPHFATIIREKTARELVMSIRKNVKKIIMFGEIGKRVKNRNCLEVGVRKFEQSTLKIYVKFEHRMLFCEK